MRSALEAAGKALRATEGNDAGILALVGERARMAAEDLWKIDEAVNYSSPLEERSEAVEEAWWADRSGTEELHHATYALPLLALATEAAATDPHSALTGARERWTWCHHQAAQSSEDLMAWVKAHEKDVGKPKENGTGDHPISHAEEPQEPEGAPSKRKEPLDAVDIHYRVQEALRPLRIMADAEILMQGRYRDGENDGESDRAEDLARLAKQAYEGLRAFEDTGRDPILPEARDLLWWGQAVCVALDALALRLSEDLGSALPDGVRIKNEDHPVHAALDVLSKDAFDRVRSDGSAWDTREKED